MNKPPAVTVAENADFRQPFSLVRATVYLVAILLFCLNHWINRDFGRPDIDQIAYHLQLGTQGLEASDPAIAARFLRWCVLMPLFLLAAVLLTERWAIVACRYRRILRACPLLPQVALLSAMLLWLVQLSVLDYLRAGMGPDYFSTHYVPPAKVAVQAGRPKNLVLIYVESLEAGYGDRRLFGSDLIAPLNGLDASSFGSFIQVPGTGWTIAAMVASQCAIPLKRVTIFDENTQGEQVRSFLPRAACLGDILARHGYRNVFMGGGSPSFAGKERFLRAHHYHEVLGREDWQAQGVPEAAMNGWGLFDEALFRHARAKLSQLHAAGQPFNLTLLTVDTHEPDGHLSPGCARRGHRGFTGVLRCSAAEVADFVRFVRESGYLADTNIVILGDHKARRNPLSDALARLPERTLYNAFIGAAVPPRNRDQLVHFDLLPTILELSGFTVGGGRLGLGYSGFNRHEARPGPQRLAEMRSSLLNRSEAYLALWR